MEALCGDMEETNEDALGRKKSKLQLLKTRLFGKSKKEGATGSRKLSQSASDIAAPDELGSNEDLLCNPGVMGSRALSHDSIFLADQALSTEAEATRVSSQENVQSKIKALQEKLQQQKFLFGPPPMIPLLKRPENEAAGSEEDVHHRSEMTERRSTTQDNLHKVLAQMSAHPVLPPSATPKPTPPNPSSPLDEAPLDLSAPAQFTPVLDSSAARHRLSIKPRNQRASSKKRHPTVDPTFVISDLSNSEPLTEELSIPEEHEREIVERVNETTSVQSDPRNPEPAPRTPDTLSSQQDIGMLGKMPTVTPQILRPKSHRPTDVMPRPHSSFITSEVKAKADSPGNFDIQFLRDTQKNKPWAPEIKTKTVSADPKNTGTGQPLQSPVVPDEIERTTDIKRPLPGSGSFHLSASASKRKELEERPRSGSFTSVQDHAWIKTRGKRLDTSSTTNTPKEDLKPSGAPLNLSREKTWSIKDSLRKVDSVRESKHDTDAGEAEAPKGVKEEEGKTAFGVKLRSTSQSVRQRAEAASNESPRSAASEMKQDISKTTDPISKKTACTTEATKADATTAPSTASDLTNPTLPPPVNPPRASVEAQPSQVKGVPQGPQSQATSTEMSWMSMAVEKTKSFQNLFTSKFPRETATPSQKTQDQTIDHEFGNTQTQDVKSANQSLTNAVKTETQKHKTQAQTALVNAAQQNPLKTSFEAQIKTTVSQPTPTGPECQSATQGNMWISQSPLRSVRQVESPVSSPQSTSQQPLWVTRSLKSTGLAVTASSKEAHAECKSSAATVEESVEQLVRDRSVMKQAAFLEKKSERTLPPVDGKKNENLTPSEPSVQNKESKSSVGAGANHTESPFKKIPERPDEEKWHHKTLDPCSAPSPSSTPSSSLQSLSDSGELSWIELAKRKSMAWSDKTMD